MKRIIIIHGWYGTPATSWYGWLGAELEKLGCEVVIPAMPDTENPKVQAWVNMLAQTVGQAGEDTILVGHSLGCITILRYLETLANRIQTGGAVLVAGFGKDLAYPGYAGELAGFFEMPIAWEEIKAHCHKFCVISSDNDQVVASDNHDILVGHLNAQSMWEHGKKHMSGIDGIVELPSALSAVKDML